MSIKTNILGKLAAIAGASVLVVGFTAGASAYQCKNQAEAAYFVSPSAATAMQASRAVWASKVQQKFGLEWSVHTIAAAPSQVCNPATGGTQCTFIAKPCKYVVQ